VVEWIRRYAPQAKSPARQTGWADATNVSLGALLGAIAVIATTRRRR